MSNINFEDLLTIYTIDQLQDLEDAFFSLLSVLDIDTLEGEPLLRIAEKIGLQDIPSDTTTLRTFIKGKIAVNSSDGTYPALYSVWKTLSGATQPIIIPLYPMQLNLYTDVAITSDLAEIMLEFMQKSAASGVLVKSIAPLPDPSDTYFTYNGTTAQGYNQGVYLSSYAEV